MGVVVMNGQITKHVKHRTHREDHAQGLSQKETHRSGNQSERDRVETVEKQLPGRFEVQTRPDLMFRASDDFLVRIKTKHRKIWQCGPKTDGQHAPPSRFLIPNQQAGGDVSGSIHVMGERWFKWLCLSTRPSVRIIGAFPTICKVRRMCLN